MKNLLLFPALLCAALIAASLPAAAQSWQPLSSSFTPNVPLGVVQLSAGAGTSGWAILATGGLQNAVPYCLHADNSNSAWSLSALPLPGDWTPVSISGLDASTAWVAAYSLLTEDSGIIFKTTNGGQTWSRQLSIAFSDAVQLIHFFNANDGVAIGELSVFTTANGGTSWTKKPNLPTQGGFSTGFLPNAMEVKGGTIWVGDVTGRFYKSTDKGNSWVKMTGAATGYTISGIAFQDAQNGLATVERFVNGGSNTSSNGYFTDDAHYYKTTDGGNSWTQATYSFTGLSAAQQAAGIGADSKADIAWLPGSSGTYIISSGSGSGYSAISGNGGASWQLLDSNTVHLGLSFTSQTAGTSGGILDATRPGLFSWQNTASGTAVPPAAFRPLPIVPYPNPASGTVFLFPGTGTATFRYEITGIGGTVVQTGSAQYNGNSAMALPVSGLPAGSYLIRLSVGGRCYSGSFVKQ